MYLDFDAARYAPQQPIDDPTQFPDYVRSPDRAEVNGVGGEWKEFVQRMAVQRGEDPEDAWFDARMAQAKLYARADEVDGVGAAAAPKRPPGRPRVYPLLEGETAEQRAARLAANRRIRAATKNNPGREAELKAAVEAVEHAHRAYLEAKAALLLLRAELRG